MKRKALALTLILALLAVAGTHFVNLGKSNPFTPIPPAVHPQITILSPEDNTLHASNALTITFNVSIGSFNASLNLYFNGTLRFVQGQGYISYVAYKASWQQDTIFAYNGTQSLSERSYKLNLTGIPEGKQTVMISAKGYGDCTYDGRLYRFTNAYNSTSVSFTIRSVSVLSPQNKTYDTSDVPLLFKVHKSSTQIAYSLDGQEKVMVSGNTTLTDVPAGDHNVTFYVMDEAGNIGASETIHFTIESFPTALVAAAFVATVAVVGVGLLVYFKKRKP